MPDDVAFHTGLPDKQAYGLRLLRKAWRLRTTVVVRGPDDLLARLDAALWAAVPGDFVPHWRVRAGRAVPPRLARTPIWLVDAGCEAPPAEVVVNLGPEPLPDAGRYARIIELVDRSDDDRAAGRRRWREHEQRGLRPVHLSPMEGGE